MIIHKILANNLIWIKVDNYAQLIIVERFMGNHGKIDDIFPKPAYICYMRVKLRFGEGTRVISSCYPGSTALVIPFESFRWLIDDEAPLSVLYGDLKS